MRRLVMIAMHSSMVCCGPTKITELVMISRIGVVFEERSFRITLQAKPNRASPACLRGGWGVLFQHPARASQRYLNPQRAPVDIRAYPAGSERRAKRLVFPE